MNSHHTAMNVYCIIHCRVLLMSGTAVMGVQCEKEGVEHTALGDLRTKVWPTIPNRLGSVFEEYVFPTPLTAHFCVCVSMLEWVSSEMQMRGEDGIMACWRQPSICALNMRTSSFADVKTYSSCQQTGWKGGGGHLSHGLEHSHLPFHYREQGKPRHMHESKTLQQTPGFLSRVYFRQHRSLV